uniref:Peripherin-like n=1 Tax=Haplochromis burtoni TaxID=8153 RepID=A0A3Q2VSU1_HAPBU
MAMLRVSSYRKLFEDDSWRRNGGLSVRCAGQYRASVDCDKLDFAAARAQNKEGLDQFVQDRTVIAALNDRLVRLIELARCFEDDNESLECQITELEEELNNRQASSSITSTVAVPDHSLDAVVERLGKQRDEILNDTQELQKELKLLKKDYEKASQQRIFVRQEQQDEVDAVTAECLALREQVTIYEEQLASMETLHRTISELQKELAELEKHNEELEDEVEMKKAAYMDEIADLEATIDEMKCQKANFQEQMKEQCEDYKFLLTQKMARDMEIAAY